MYIGFNIKINIKMSGVELSAWEWFVILTQRIVADTCVLCTHRMRDMFTWSCLPYPLSRNPLLDTRELSRSGFMDPCYTGEERTNDRP